MSKLKHLLYIKYIRKAYYKIIKIHLRITDKTAPHRNCSYKNCHSPSICCLCTSAATTINHAGLPVLKFGLNFLTSTDTEKDSESPPKYKLIELKDVS